MELAEAEADWARVETQQMRAEAERTKAEELPLSSAIRRNLQRETAEAGTQLAEVEAEAQGCATGVGYTSVGEAIKTTCRVCMPQPLPT